MRELNETTISNLSRRYPKGTTLDVSIKRIKPFAAFVSVDEGVKGIIRIREMSWGAEPEHPRDVLSVGQRVKVVVLGVDRNLPRLELSLRQAERDPWQDINQRYKPGQVVRCRLTGLLQKGAFLELEPALAGFVPLHEVCDPAPEQIEKVLWSGDTVEAIITHMNHDERRIELSIKQHLRALARERQLAFCDNFLKKEDDGRASLGELLSDEGRRALINFLHRQEPSDDASVEAAEVANAAGPSVLAGKLRRILIADDDSSFRTSLQRLLRRLGHEVTAVDSGSKAVSLCAEQEFDLLLIDLGFPSGSIDGLQAIRSIVAVRPSLPVIVITGLGLSSSYKQTVADAGAVGARGVLLKPVDLSSLYNLMAAITEGRNACSEEYLAESGTENAIAPDALAGAGLAQGNFLSSIRHELAELQQQTGASACVIFQLTPSSREVRVLMHAGSALKGYEEHKYTLRATPVLELIRYGKEVFETDTTLNPQKFRYLNLLDFQSCMGVPVKSLGRAEYGLFLFHPQKGHFIASHLRKARVSAKLIGAVIAREEAEQLVQRVQPFVFAGQIGSVLIHELNNRLGSTSNFTKTLKVDHAAIEKDPTRAMDPQLRHRMQKCLQDLENNHRSVEKMMGLFMGLMNKERRELVDINESLRRVRNLLAPIAERDRVEIRLKLEDDLPPTLAIGVWLEQVFVNVALNAIQNTNLARGEGELVVETRFVGHQEQLPLQVRFADTGPGIHGQHVENIFELGFSTRPEGTGLGLFTSKRLVEALRGRISVEKSVMMVGTTFLIELPLVVPSVERSAP